MSTIFRLLPRTLTSYLANPQFDLSQAAPPDASFMAGAAASEFWFFHRGKISLTGIKAAGIISPNGTPPTWGPAGFTIAPSGSHNGLKTNIDELASETWIIVFLMPLTADASRDILGNFATATGGWGLSQLSGTGLRLSTKAAINNNITLTIPSGLAGGGQICALAIAHQSTSRKYRFRNGSSTTSSMTRIVSDPVRKIALGEVFNSNGHSLPVTIYAAASYSSYLSDGAIDAEIETYIVPYCNNHGVNVTA